MTDEVTMARTGLLDALEALELHLDALVIIGAQAIYLHTGAMEIALAEFTTDGDVAVDESALMEALAAPFEETEVKFKPQIVKGNRALALAYVDARVIQDRLDDVLGTRHWQDDYECLPDGSVLCRLKIRVGGEWLTKVDVGGQSEQSDTGDRVKAAFSDALKRAAVKFGIGRYLYRLQAQWVDYDPAKRTFASTPQLPPFALPKTKAPKAKAAPKPQSLPSSGEELHRRLQEYDAKLASQKLCVRGALLAHVTQAGVKAGYTANMTDWTGPAIPFAVDAVKEFETSIRGAKTDRQTAA